MPSYPVEKMKGTPRLTKFGCGCIGLPYPNLKSDAILEDATICFVIKHCTKDSAPSFVGIYDRYRKDDILLTPEESAKVLFKLNCKYTN